jgi:hypothetical protein
MKISAWLFVGALGMFAALPAAAQRKPAIQVAILLDTSNSMDGLIDQARSQLWRMVNEFALAKKNGRNADLHVALYEYGNSRLPQSQGYIRRVLPFTTDLDRLSEELFALRTNGGDEYCGQVIAEATKGLEWSSSGEDLKVVFIAGTEPFTQGSVSFAGACRKAVGKGIVVNTIFCGEKREGVETRWKDGADFAGGRYMSIDQNIQVPDIDAPQDPEIARLGMRLNTTYIAYGKSGKEGQARQSAQDANYASKAAANAERQVSKSNSAIYSNSVWDLVDAKKDGAVDLDKLAARDLPPEMQKMTAIERKAYVTAKEKERTEIQTQIQKLDGERKKYIAAELKKRQPPTANTFDAAIIATVRAEAGMKGFKF